MTKHRLMKEASDEVSNMRNEVNGELAHKMFMSKTLGMCEIRRLGTYKIVSRKSFVVVAS